MKRFFAIFIAMLAFTAVHAQVSNPEQTEMEDSAAVPGVDVMAWFCVRDTMEYRFIKGKFKTLPSDTIVTSYYGLDFSLCVTDSTENNYRLEYVADNYERLDTITTDPQALIHQHVFERMKGKKLIFEITEMGELVQLVNWRDVRDDIIQGVYMAYNELFESLPGLEELVPKGQLMGLVSDHFRTEEGVRSWFEEVEMLFTLHGRHFDESVESDSPATESEFASKSVLEAGMEDEEDADFEDDYYVFVDTYTELNGADVPLYLKSKVDMLGEGNELEKQLLSGLDDSDGLSMSVHDGLYHHHFFNGWPKRVKSFFEESTPTMSIVTTKSVEWLSRSWWNFAP